MRFFESIKMLFPRSRIFNFKKGGNSEKFMEALSLLPEDVRSEAEKNFMNIFPQNTSNIEEWEKAFQIQFTSLLTEEQRRNILSSLWQMRYGLSTTDFLQGLLQNFLPEIQVVENVPLGNPRMSNFAYKAVDGNKRMCDGNKQACDGYRVGASSFVPSVLRNGTEGVYDIPVNRRAWETCFYVCGGVERNRYGQIVYANILQLNKKWKDFIEYIILSVKPVHTTAIVFIKWIDEEE